MGLTLTAILLGIVEGLTEFVPVSSTGHLMLASELFGYDAAQWALFNVLIQLGAILAVVVLYWRTFWHAGLGVLRLEPQGLRDFARGLGGLVVHQHPALADFLHGQAARLVEARRPEPFVEPDFFHVSVPAGLLCQGP